MNRRYRLTSSREIQDVFRNGTRGASDTVLCVAVEADAQDALVAVSASRGLGGAVIRNRAKRQMREAARAESSSMKPGIRAVLVAKMAITGKSSQVVRADVSLALRRAGAIS